MPVILHVGILTGAAASLSLSVFLALSRSILLTPTCRYSDYVARSNKPDKLGANDTLYVIPKACGLYTSSLDVLSAKTNENDPPLLPSLLIISYIYINIYLCHCGTSYLYTRGTHLRRRCFSAVRYQSHHYLLFFLIFYPAS